MTEQNEKLNLTDAQRELLEDKFLLWERSSRVGADETRDYNRRAAEALKIALAICSQAEARATASEAERDGLRAALEDVLRLADLGFEESMKEPEENGNFAAYERARSALAALKETSDAG